MIFSYFPFLFVLFLIVNTSSQLLPSSSFCLGNCATCDPLVLTKCTLPYPCDWNFYNEKDDNNCILAPSTEVKTALLSQFCKSQATAVQKCLKIHQKHRVNRKNNHIASTSPLKAKSIYKYSDYIQEHRLQKKHSKSIPSVIHTNSHLTYSTLHGFLSTIFCLWI